MSSGLNGDADASKCLCGGLVFPDTHNGPASSAKAGVCGSIARHVSLQLLGPKGGVPFWKRGVFRAHVPKAAVDEDRDT